MLGLLKERVHETKMQKLSGAFAVPYEDLKLRLWAEISPISRTKRYIPYDSTCSRYHVHGEYMCIYHQPSRVASRQTSPVHPRGMINYPEMPATYNTTSKYRMIDVLVLLYAGCKVGCINQSGTNG